MRTHLTLALTILTLTAAGCETLPGGGGGGGGAGGETIGSGNAGSVMRALVSAAKFVVPYVESDQSWNGDAVEGYYGGHATVDGDLSTVGDAVLQLTLDTEIEFFDFCDDAEICFDGDVDYAGWIERVDDSPDEYHGGWAVQGSVDVVGEFGDTIDDMELMIVAHDRYYGWIEVDGSTYEL